MTSTNRILWRRLTVGHNRWARMMSQRLDALRLTLKAEDQELPQLQKRRRRKKSPSPGVIAATRRFKDGQCEQFWKRLPAYENVPVEQFLCPSWQRRHSVDGSGLAKFFAANLQAQSNTTDLTVFSQDALEGVKTRPMKVKVTPYVLSRINWEQPYQDPLRRQFIPVATEAEHDHPATKLDSLSERQSLAATGSTSGVVHRYPDKVLLLANSTCPVYCQYCTRSYAIGPATPVVGQKHKYAHQKTRWIDCIKYVNDTPSIRDVTISGGDVSMLSGQDIAFIGEGLLAAPHVQCCLPAAQRHRR